jgi:hypothetical protein
MRCTAMADRTLGQVAYEKYVQVSRDQGRKPPWGQLRPPVRARWETIATAVVEACGGSGG